MARTFAAAKNTTKGAPKVAPKAPSQTDGESERADLDTGAVDGSVAPVMVRFGDAADLSVEPEDLVLVVKGARASMGIPSKSGKDTRVLTTTPGMFTWLQGLPHPSNRRIGVKLTVLLSKPIKVREDGTEDAAGDEDRSMAAML